MSDFTKKVAPMSKPKNLIKKILKWSDWHNNLYDILALQCYDKYIIKSNEKNIMFQYGIVLIVTIMYIVSSLNLTFN